MDINCSVREHKNDFLKILIFMNHFTSWCVAQSTL